MQGQYTSCHLTCHRCGHAWTYMGIRLAGLKPLARPVKVQCPRCKARVAWNCGMHGTLRDGESLWCSAGNSPGERKKN
jgi:hypothetical protein